MQTEHIIQALRDPEITAMIESKLGNIEDTPEVTGPSLDDLMTLTAVPKRFPDLFTANQLRWMHFDAKVSGWADHGVSFKIGRRIYVNVPALRRWMLAHAD